MKRNKAKSERSRRRLEQRQRQSAAQSGESLRRTCAPSASPGLQAVESFDGHAALRNGLRLAAALRENWAGIPMPLEDERLVVEPSYEHADALMAMCGGREPTEPSPFSEYKVRNSFQSMFKRSEVEVLEKPDGSITWGLVPAVHHLEMELVTLGCSDAWGIEQEHAALQLLGRLVAHRAFKQYLLTGSFLETSKRSGVTYLFRKLRPTVALHAVDGGMRILCALCLHPIAYYAGSWAGAMTPTDDVIAHLMLMRADEPMLWRRANQHPAWRPEAGI